MIRRRDQRVDDSTVVDVCIATTIHGDFDNRIYQRQLSALADAGLSVCIVAPWRFEQRKRDDFSYRKTRMPRNRLFRVWHSVRTFRSVFSVRAKIYIFHDPDFLPFAPLLKIARRAPVIYDCHENIPEDIQYGKDWIPRVFRRPLSVAFRMVENAVVRQLGLAIVSVPNLQDRFSKQGVDVVTIRNFANFERPHSFDHMPGVLYTGSLSRDYGALVILDIARELRRRGRKIPIRIIERFGSKPDLEMHFRESVEREGLWVEFIEPVPADEMPRVLRMGSIGISPCLDVPNKALALPTKIFEFFAFRLAVIGSDISGTRAILKNGELGVLVRDVDISGWADAIEALYDDDAMRCRFADAGERAYKAQFNWDTEKVTLVDYVRRQLDDCGKRGAV